MLECISQIINSLSRKEKIVTVVAICIVSIVTGGSGQKYQRLIKVGYKNMGKQYKSTYTFL